MYKTGNEIYICILKLYSYIWLFIYTKRKNYEHDYQNDYKSRHLIGKFTRCVVDVMCCLILHNISLRNWLESH